MENEQKEITPLKIYRLSDINNNKGLQNSKFIEQNNISTVIQDLENQFKPEITYQGRDILNKLKLYLKQNFK